MNRSKKNRTRTTYHISDRTSGKNASGVPMIRINNSNENRGPRSGCNPGDPYRYCEQYTDCNLEMKIETSNSVSVCFKFYLYIF